MAVINTNLVCDLQNAVKVQYLDGNIFSQDNQGNVINVTVLDGGEPATLSGTISANIIRADGGTVAATGGTITDNVASITLPAAAYAIPGVVSIVIKNTVSSVVTTIAAIVANVYQSSTDTVVDPGTIIPSVQTLISAIETAVASIPADYSSLWTSLAPAFSSSANYVAGQYVTYNGGLYRFTTAHSGSWSSSDVVATNLGGDVSDLKSAFDATVEKNELIRYEIIDSWASGAIYYNTGAVEASTNFNKSDYIEIEPGTIIEITVPIYKSSQGTRVNFGYALYNGSKAYVSGYQMKLASESNTAEVVKFSVPSNVQYIRTTWFKDTYSDYDYPAGFSMYVYPQKDEGYTVVLGRDEINEYFAIKSDGQFSASSFGLTSYIDCLGTEVLSVKMPILSNDIQNTVGLAFYNSEKTQISFVASNRGASNGAEIRNIAVPDGAKYFRCSYWSYANAKLYGGDWSCTFKTKEYVKYRPYQSGYIFFSPEVNQSVNQYWEDDLDTELDAVMKPTTGVLLLPSTYTQNGKPTPIIMYFHGYSHYVYYDNWGASDDFRTQKAQWAAQGFAVMDCNGARNNNKTGGFTSGGSIQYSDGYHKCFEYVKKHYNVEQYCHVICASAGGIPGINYCYWFNDAKSLLMLSAWTSLYNNQYGTGQTASMVEYLGCDFTDGYDTDKTIGFDPTLRILNISGTDYLPQLKIPAKAMIGSTESGNHIWNALYKFVTALRNAGQSVNIRVVDGAEHADICSSSILALNTEYANWCKMIG